MPLGDVEIVGEVDKDDTGTTIHFLPDAEIFEEVDFSISTLVQRLRETAFLTRGLRIVAHRRARGRGAARVLRRGRDQGLRRLRQRREGPGPQAHRLLRGRERGRRASRWRCSGTPPTSSRSSPSRTTSTRTRAAPTSPGFRAALTGTLNRYARDEGPAEGEGGQPRGRGRPRGPRRRDLGQAARTRSSRARRRRSSATRRSRPRQADRQPEAGRVPRGEPAGRAPDHHEGDLGRAAPARPRARRAS